MRLSRKSSTPLGRPGQLVLFFVAVLVTVSLPSQNLLVLGQEAEPNTEESATTTTNDETPPDATKQEEPPAKAAEEPPKKVVEEEEPEYLAAELKSWGTYYDPQGEFCGQYDCYSIFGFDYENYKPDTKEIVKRYRRLGRKWHPDKSKHPNAKERFVKIVRAYEVLTDNEKRKEYDFMRYNQEAYYQKYGTSVLWSYAPKSDVTFILIVLTMAINAFSWFAQKTKWQNVADRLIKAAAEEWSPSQGGSPESKELREHALQLLAEREAKNATEDADGDDKSTKKKKVKKVSGKEKKKQELEALMPVLRELVDEMDDFGGGFHKPTWKDLLIVSLSKLPYRITTGIIWEAGYYMRRFQKKDLSDEEKDVLTERAVGPVAWDIASEETRQEMIKRELWVQDNLVEWKEEEEIKNLSKWEQKEIKKMKKEEKKKGSKQL